MTLMEKEILEQPKVLATLKAANMDTIKALVADIKARGGVKAVYFAARGTSDHASIYAQYLIGTLVGVPCGLATPSVITAYNGKLDLSDCLVFGVSQSGKAADALAVMDRAKENGAITVSVTNDLESPMAKAAKYHLYCNAGEEKSVAATKTFTTQMFNLALFVAEWSDNEELKNLLDKVPEALAKMLEYIPAQIDAIINRYRYMNDGFVLARGMNYPIALEGTLKLQETNYVKMKGYAVSDFHHGPLAQVEVDTPVFLYASKGPVFKDCLEMLAKLDDIGAEVIVVSDDKELVESRKFGFLIPDLGSDMVSIYFNAVFAQLFACKLTAVKGRNPDAPRNLKKVTITK